MGVGGAQRRVDPAGRVVARAVHVITAVAQAITIIGIPLAIANLKMIPISLFPYGKRIVPTDSLSPADRPLHSL